jgi:branched-chain amino acid transport system permease protein
MRVAGDFDTTYSHDMALIRNRFQWTATIALLVVLYALPLLPRSIVSGYHFGILNTICIFGIAALGLNILVGMTGQISLGQAAFVAVGGYASTLLVTKAGVPFWFALPIAGLFTGLIGVLFGLPSLRIKGFYLSMATLAAQFIIPWFFRNVWTDVLGGTNGLRVPSPTIGDFRFNEQHTMWYIILTVTVVCIVISRNITRTRLGRAFVSIRDNDIAAEVLGIELYAYKLRAFFLASVYAGIAGSLWAHYNRDINPAEPFTLADSVFYLGMIIVGGAGTTLGPILGAAFVRLLEELSIVAAPTIFNLFPAVSASFLQSSKPILFGLILMVFLILEPRGLAHRWDIVKAAWRIRPFAH